ncbi:MAG TPA: glutamine--tRNA ligase/YqeY domain fusion protein, partial [Ignavibacteria bacterium]|nr:glutamine--tRNA ligase/YqeY domain fusion protein [Ignavibacteria bacterium]
MENTEEKNQHNDFIRQKIREDLKENKNKGRVHTRFPPEPNGYLHIGHAQAIWLNFGLAEEFNGMCNLRFDDTNPEKEDVEYVDSIMEDIKWLGYDWDDRLYYASDYFEQLYNYAVELIKKGKAYVDSLTPEEIKEYRGIPTEPGKESPYRNRTVEENLNLFERMRAGEFEESEHLLRAKIDMASPNMNLRDPAIYRIRKAHHHRTGDTWCIYPMYDFAHGQSDALEGITHSICTLEFENHRPLYDWFLDNLSVPNHPQQIEFARLNINYTVMSKRKLLTLVENNIVSGWDDPRMPTLSGFRRRGYTPEAIKNFVEKAGVAKRESIIDIALLEHSIREDLNKKSQRVMSVLNPVKVIFDNYPEDQSEELDAVNNPEDESMGKRKITFSKEIYIEREDFMEDPPRKFFRLSPNNEVRLRYAFIIKCVSVIKDEHTGEVKEIHCTYDPETKSGMPQSSRKVKGTIHWVSAKNSIDAEVRLYDRLFTVEEPTKDKEKDFTDFLNPDSLKVLTNCKVEPWLKDAKPLDKVQFERRGYFCVDSKDSSSKKLVFNRTVPLRDTWAKIAK